MSRLGKKNHCFGVVAKGAALALAVLLAVASVPAAAHPQYQQLIPNGMNVVRNGVRWDGVGHVTAGGGTARNPFGLAFAAGGYTWSKAFCEADADGDGFTNGMELGDPGCVWTPGATPSRTTGISHPGFADSTPATIAPTTTEAPPTTISAPPPPSTAPGETSAAATPVASTTAAPATPEPSSTEAPPPQIPPSTASPPPPPTPSTVAPIEVGERSVESTVASLVDGKVQLRWRVYAAAATSRRASADDVLEIELGGPAPGQFVGIGFADNAMDGPIITCTVNPADGRPLCSDWRGSNYNIYSREPATSIVSSSVNNGSRWTVVVRAPAGAMEVKSGTQRMIVSTGQYVPSINMPLPHNFDGRQPIGVNVYAGTIQTGTRKYFYAAIAMVLIVAFLYMATVTIMNAAGVMLRPRAVLAGYAFTGVLFMAVAAVYIWLCYEDHKANFKTHAAERALGDGVVFCFWFVLYPVPKHLGLGRLAGSSYERLVSYHALVACCIWAIATAHFIAMALTMKNATDEIFAWTNGLHPRPVIAGFLAWLFLTIVVLVSLFLRRVAYWLFKLTHLLVVPTIVFAILHYNKLILALIPPLVLYGSDILLRVFFIGRSKARIVSAHVAPKASFVALTVQLVSATGVMRPKPGAFVNLAIATHCPQHVNVHPFSVAWFDEATWQAKFFIKNMGPNTFTGKLAAAVAADPAGFAERARVVWTGPVGTLQVPLGSVKTVVLVAGGIGVTPLLSILQAVCERRDGGEGVERVVLLWALREVALFDEVRPLLEQCVAKACGEPAATSLGEKAPASLRGVPLRIELFGTNLVGENGIAGQPMPAHQIHGRRLDPAADVARALGTLCTAADTEHPTSSSDASVPYATPGRDRIAIYSCGPEALMESVAAYAGSSPRIYLHEETFVL